VAESSIENTKETADRISVPSVTFCKTALVDLGRSSWPLKA